MKKLPLISVSMLLAATSWAATNYPPLTASELLDRFAAAQEPLKSFITVTESWGREDGILPVTKRGDFGFTNEVRLQGTWVAERTWSWGPWSLGGQRGTRAKPLYLSRLTDGQRVLYYQPVRTGERAVCMPRVVHHDVPIEAIADAQAFRMCLGNLFGNRRLDFKLRNEPTLRVRDKLELAGWVPMPCYVLEAETAEGHHTIWLNPARGYQIAKWLFGCGTGYSRPNGQPEEPGTSKLWTIGKVRWEQRENVWVPVEETGGFEEISRYTGWAHARRTGQFKLTRFVLNPDHSAFRSFVPDDIPDGTKFTLIGEDRRVSNARRCTWQKGCAVDAAGNVLWAPESLGGTATNQPPHSGRTDGADKPKPTGNE